MPGRFAAIRTKFAGRAWSVQLGLELDELIGDLVEANAASQGIPDTPVPIQAGVEGDPGTTSGPVAPALEDHVHAIETAAPAGLSNSNSEGSGTALMRADAGIKRDVRVALGGVDVGTRNRLNFVAPAGSVTDDPGNDEVDVDLTAIASAEAESSARRWAWMFGG